jgi:hypothetical protein
MGAEDEDQKPSESYAWINLSNDGLTVTGVGAITGIAIAEFIIIIGDEHYSEFPNSSAYNLAYKSIKSSYFSYKSILPSNAYIYFSKNSDYF